MVAGRKWVVSVGVACWKDEGGGETKPRTDSRLDCCAGGSFWLVSWEGENTLLRGWTNGDGGDE
jgi:hypothetical protein